MQVNTRCPVPDSTDKSGSVAACPPLARRIASGGPSRKPGTAPALAATVCLIGGAVFSAALADSRENPTVPSFSVSPDGELLALSNDSGLWIMPTGGGAARSLLPTGTVAHNPSFSPDGTLLVYQSRQSEQWDLWTVELAGGEVRQITATDYHEVEPVYWPDGHSVVFASDRAGTFDIWELHLSSGALRRLTGRSGTAYFPSVSEHGDVVYANEADDGRWSLYLLRTGVTTLLARRSHPLQAPSWRPGGGLVVLTEQPAPNQGKLVMLLLDSQPLFRDLSRGERVEATPAAWFSGEQLVYAASGLLWSRPLGSGPPRSVPFIPVAP